jgi:ankyrin repeat protein
MQPKTDDGFTALHIAAGTNDAPLIDLIIHSVDETEQVANR